MNQATGGVIARHVAILVLLLSGPTAADTQPRPGSTIKPPPEIVALMPSGKYVGRGERDGKGYYVALVIEQSKPGGRFAGTLVLYEAPPPCGTPFPIIGEMQSNGAVRIESKQGVVDECVQGFKLNLAGDELTGRMVGSEGTFDVKLKKQ